MKTLENCVIFDIESMIYQVCAAHERDGKVNLNEYTDEIDSRIRFILEKYKANHYLIFLDNNQPNFRHTILSTYKSGRNPFKPRFYMDVKKHLMLKWNAIMSNVGLEADDVVMIHLVALRERYNIIVAAIDKDLRQYPGTFWYFKPGSEEEVIITQEQAYFNLWTQVLVGDSGDKIPGLLGCGITTANKVLTANIDADISYKAWIKYTTVLGMIKGTQAMAETLSLVSMIKTLDDAREYAPEFDLTPVNVLTLTTAGTVTNPADILDKLLKEDDPFSNL